MAVQEMEHICILSHLGQKENITMMCKVTVTLFDICM